MTVPEKTNATSLVEGLRFLARDTELPRPYPRVHLNTAADAIEQLERSLSEGTKSREVLERLCKALGEMPHDWPSQDLYKAYKDAANLLDPDEFTERFMAQGATK